MDSTISTVTIPFNKALNFAIKLLKIYDFNKNFDKKQLDIIIIANQDYIRDTYIKPFLQENKIPINMPNYFGMFCIVAYVNNTTNFGTSWECVLELISKDFVAVVCDPEYGLYDVNTKCCCSHEMKYPCVVSFGNCHIITGSTCYIKTQLCEKKKKDFNTKFNINKKLIISKKSINKRTKENYDLCNQCNNHSKEKSRVSSKCYFCSIGIKPIVCKKCENTWHDPKYKQCFNCISKDNSKIKCEICNIKRHDKKYDMCYSCKNPKSNRYN